MTYKPTIKQIAKLVDAKNVDSPRMTGRKAIQATIEPSVWSKNVEYCLSLKSMIDKHKLCRHPLIGLLSTEKLNVEATKLIHFEFSYAFAEIFTDSVIQTMITSSQLERRIGPMGKVSARFLLELNLMDELGFQAKSNANDSEDYSGNPLLAHYSQFNETIEELGSNHDELLNYKPSAAAEDARKTFTENYGNHLMMTSVLAVAESIFTLFAGPWAKSVGLSTDVDVSRGYHKIHVEDDCGEFLDDEHSEDTWYLLRQAIQEPEYAFVKEQISTWLDVWYDFADQVMHIANKHSKK
jgi:hypothetical protein